MSTLPLATRPELVHLPVTLRRPRPRQARRLDPGLPRAELPVECWTSLSTRATSVLAAVSQRRSRAQLISQTSPALASRCLEQSAPTLLSRSTSSEGRTGDPATSSRRRRNRYRVRRVLHDRST